MAGGAIRSRRSLAVANVCVGVSEREVSVPVLRKKRRRGKAEEGVDVVYGGEGEEREKV